MLRISLGFCMASLLVAWLDGPDGLRDGLFFGAVAAALAAVAVAVRARS